MAIYHNIDRSRQYQDDNLLHRGRRDNGSGGSVRVVSPNTPDVQLVDSGAWYTDPKDDGCVSTMTYHVDLSVGCNPVNICPDTNELPSELLTLVSSPGIGAAPPVGYFYTKYDSRWIVRAHLRCYVRSDYYDAPGQFTQSTPPLISCAVQNDVNAYPQIALQLYTSNDGAGMVQTFLKQIDEREGLSCDRYMYMGDEREIEIKGTDGNLSGVIATNPDRIYPMVIPRNTGVTGQQLRVYLLDFWMEWELVKRI